MNSPGCACCQITRYSTFLRDLESEYDAPDSGVHSIPFVKPACLRSCLAFLRILASLGDVEIPGPGCDLDLPEMFANLPLELVKFQDGLSTSLLVSLCSCAILLDIEPLSRFLGICVGTRMLMLTSQQRSASMSVPAQFRSGILRQLRDIPELREFAGLFL